MGSSDFLSEAAIDDDSEKCYLPRDRIDLKGFASDISTATRYIIC